MKTKNKNLNANSVDRITKCLDSCVYPSLLNVLVEAHRANAISFNHKFGQIFMNRLAEELWYNNPMHPERNRTSGGKMQFTVDSSDGINCPRSFSWGMSQNQAATIIQVLK